MGGGGVLRQRDPDVCAERGVLEGVAWFEMLRYQGRRWEEV